MMGQCEATPGCPQEGEGHWRKQGQQEALGLGWIAAVLVRGCPKSGMGSGPEQQAEKDQRQNPQTSRYQAPGSGRTYLTYCDVAEAAGGPSIEAQGLRTGGSRGAKG